MTFTCCAVETPSLSVSDLQRKVFPLTPTPNSSLFNKFIAHSEEKHLEQIGLEAAGELEVRRAETKITLSLGSDQDQPL